MKRLTFVASSIALVSMQSACTMHRVPPPSAPDASMPDVGDLPTSGGGMARVVIGTDVPARVERITHRVARVDREERGPSSISGGEGLLCAETPCVVTLPYGDYELVFKGAHDGDRVSRTTLAVRRDTIVLNHTLGRSHRPAGQAVGYALAILGGVLVGAALGLAEVDRERRVGAHDVTVPAIAGSGFGMMVLGGIVAFASPGTTQDGASTQ
jgi:hypothetical protein